MINMGTVFGADSVIKDSSGNRVGHTVRAKIQKNKVGAPFRQAEYKVEYVKGIVNIEGEIFDLAVKYGLIERPSNQSYLINGEKIRGRDNAVSSFSEDTALVEDYNNTVRDMYLGNEEPIAANGAGPEDAANPLISAIE
jgi:recombination protein RecA